MATEAEFWGRSLEPCAARLDTSSLGPIRVDPDRLAVKARIVREALRHIATDPACCATLPLIDRTLAYDMANHASDETLAKLGRMLKHG